MYNIRVFISLIILSSLIVGCQSKDSVDDIKEEKVIIYVVDEDESPVQNFEVSLSETGNSADFGIILGSTDVERKIERILKRGSF